MTRAELLHKRLRLAAILIIVGLLMQAFSFIWAHPAAFLLDVLVGGAIMFAGIFVYMLALFHPRPWVWIHRLMRREPPALSDDLG